MNQREPYSLTPEEVADRIGTTGRQIRRLIRRGKLRGIDVSAGEVPRYRLRESDVQSFIDQRSDDTE